MRKLLIAIIFFSIAVPYVSCKRESALLRTELHQVDDARTWLNNYLSRNTVNPLFKQLEYHWDKAGTFTYKNGYQAITVPVTDKKQNPAYAGHRVLYLYPWKNGKGYYLNLYELIPDLKHVQKNKGKIDLHNYTGLVNSWDLIKGFNGGGLYIDGSPYRNVNVTPLAPGQTIDRQAGRTGGTTLPNVTVVGYIPAPNWGGVWITLMNSMGYSNSYLWGGGGGGSNPCEYGGCNVSTDPGDYFDQGYIDQIMQELWDQQWVDENVKDSTNNPCATSVINALGAINAQLPELIRDFFNSNANFSMTIKMDNNSTWGANGQAPEGGHTVTNITTNDFEVYLNSYYSNITDLGTASTIIHEALHCQLMNWYKDAVSNNDRATQEQLAADYGYMFGDVFNTDSTLSYIVNGGNATQHQDMIARYQNTIAQSLYQFAQSRGISTTLDYCKDLAWTGTFDSRAFSNLSYSAQERIRDRVLAEKDPYSALSDPTSTYTVNANNVTPKGTPCP